MPDRHGHGLSHRALVPFAGGKNRQGYVVAASQVGGDVEGLFALWASLPLIYKSLASAQPAGPGQQRSLREPKPVLSAGKSKILAVGA